MTPEAFCYWIQGLFEIANPKSLDARQVQIIKDHLAEVFHKVTPDRSESPVRDDPGTSKQEILDWIKKDKQKKKEEDDLEKWTCSKNDDISTKMICNSRDKKIC